MMAHLAGCYANGGRLFLMEGLRGAREQQRQVDAGGGQAGSQITGRRQIEFFDRGGTSEEGRGGPRTPIYIKGVGKFCPQFRRPTVVVEAKSMEVRCRQGCD